MQKKNNNYMTKGGRWCAGASLLFFTPVVFALGLGELQVTSNLGEPLKAIVPLLELGRMDPLDVKMRLADSEQYKKNGLPYSPELRLKFKIIGSGETQPFVRISSVYPIDEPFLTLLIEVSSPNGVLYKTYTFLLDPAPDLLAAPVVVEPARVASPVAKVDTQPLSSPAPNAVLPTPAVREKPAPVKKSRPHRPPRSALSANTLSHQNTVDVPSTRSVGQAQSFGKLSLTLSTSLSISKNDPSASLGTIPMTEDALQEELIAKEKSLKDLNLQIAEMQSVIKNLQIKLGQTGGASSVSEASLQGESAVVASGVLVSDTVSEASAVQAATAVKVPAAVVTNAAPAAPLTTKISALWELYRVKILAAFALLLAALGGGYWYRRRQEEQAWSHGPFDDLDDEPTQTVVLKQPAQPPIATMKAPIKVGEKSIKTPAFQPAKDNPLTVPAEYDFLEEADIYLRFGHDKLAEEVLREAIKINPNNPHSYLTLLGVLETRGDVKEFAETAKSLKSIGDTTDWHKAMQMGKKLDPTNPLYDN